MATSEVPDVVFAAHVDGQDTVTFTSKRSPLPRGVVLI
jgi:hypothetical protein